MLGDVVVVDEATTSFVQGSHKACVIVERRQHQRIVLAVDLKDCLDVNFGVLWAEAE